MSNYFETVKDYLTELDFDITIQNEAEELIVLNDETKGINNLVIDCEAPIVIIEQFIFDVKNENLNTYKRLLQMNRNIVHGAFVLNEEGTKVLFRDTLQIENLDLNELEASIHALSLALVENANELIEFSK